MAGWLIPVLFIGGCVAGGVIVFACDLLRIIDLSRRLNDAEIVADGRHDKLHRKCEKIQSITVLLDNRQQNLITRLDEIEADCETKGDEAAELQATVTQDIARLYDKLNGVVKCNDILLTNCGELKQAQGQHSREKSDLARNLTARLDDMDCSFAMQIEALEKQLQHQPTQSRIEAVERRLSEAETDLSEVEDAFEPVNKKMDQVDALRAQMNLFARWSAQDVTRINAIQDKINLIIPDVVAG